MLKFTELAKSKIKEFITQTDKKDMSLRVSVTGRTPTGFNYAFSLEDYDAERPTDQYVREGGFATRIDPESAKWLKGATIDWTTKDGQAGFSVENPNNPAPAETEAELKEQIVDYLKTIFDPEIPVNIYDLGLIYNISIDDAKNVTVQMTLTAPNCPAAEQLPLDVKNKVSSVPGVQSSEVELTWEPPWDKDKMSEAARLQLGM
ncbi:MAG: SUF system Fe-S cluster assembly protein [Bdellovibrionales bacterium]|nr:SUF system Fe-S cluster assembly protein [Bdellovibrionales bacterium]